MEESKRKSRSEKERSSHRDRDDRVRDKDRNGRDKDRDRYDREKSVDDSKYKDVEKHKDRHRDKDRDRDREERKSRDKDRDVEERKSREKSRDVEERKSREKSRDVEERKSSRDKDREDKRLKEKEREREREREREKERERERRERKEKEKERERREREKERERKERDRYREREKRRDRSNSGDEEDVVREKEKKRRRREVDDDKVRDVREGSLEVRSRGKGDEDVVVRKERTREEDMAEEQKILDDEIEKRRKRVQEWQERKRKEESEREKSGVEESKDEVKSGKAWTLDGESDDEENATDGKSNMNVDNDDEEGFIPNGDRANGMDIDSGNNEVTTAVENGADNAVEEDEIDPLDAFMNSMVLPEVENLIKSVPPAESVPEVAERNGKAPSQPLKKAANRNTGRIIQGEDSDSDYEESEVEEGQSDDENDEQWSKRLKKTKVEKLSIVDHSKIEYPSFRKNFYTEVKEIKKMTPEEVAEYRVELELKIHGKDVPKPIKSWHQTGLSTKVLDIIRKLDFKTPMSIQAQALPIIMSGRDCIGIAKTGSGKTLAFVLPMLRHIKDQPPLMSGDGPIGLIMAPTRELVKQIYDDIKKFTKGMGLTCVPIYGGSGVAQQISDLKRGAEIVVCTPGRMIDILCTSAGKITNLRRVTYLVMDEADRMFDMGFEPQITRIVQNTRPDRQTVLFSATFPRQVETLARKVLNKPVEIQVGGRSVVNKDITQLVEVRPESDRFLRLLELLGEWYEKGKVLIFVHSQDKCDSLFKDLLKAGYPCLSLHGAKDQTDRESTLSDFKGDVCNLMVATSVAARGLDVKELELVINFDAPNHYEDYVHRVGRTGRAGRKGCAITFISEDDARYAPDLVKALQLSEQSVPADLKALADSFNEKVNQGQAQTHGTGYGGTGYKFNQAEEEAKEAQKKAQMKSLGYTDETKSDSDDDDDGVRKAGGDVTQESMMMVLEKQVASLKANTAIGGLPVSLPGFTVPPVVPGSNDGSARAAALAAAMNLKFNLAKIHADAMPEHYEAELEINDFPQNARWKVTHKDTLGPISDWTGAAITTRGQYHEPGKVAGPGDRKLYLFIEGPTEQSVKKAKAELKRVLEDITTQASSLPGSAQQPGRYSVI